ncbi:MAG: putative dsRNA-binding protein, partial [Prevotella sp.]
KEVNFKSKLIEWSQKNRVKLNFKLLEENKDKNGSPVFSYQVVLEGVEGCCGKGFSKKESQQKASKDTLNKLKREPQFIDQVFAAKGERTKMEEEPTGAVPDTSEVQAFIVTSGAGDNTADKHETAFRATVFSETESAEEEQHETVMEQSADDALHADEFDLSDISAKAKSREDIIAAAEQAAFRGEN